MKKKIVMLLYFTLVAFVIIHVSEYVLKRYYGNRYSDRPIMTDSIFFIMDTKNRMVDLSHILPNNVISDYTLLSIDESDTDKYHVICSQGKYDIFYGSLPVTWDFDGNDIAAIVGIESEIPDVRILGYLIDDGIYAKKHAVFMLDRKLTSVDTSEIFVLASGKVGEAEKQFEYFEKKCREAGVNVININMQSPVFGQYSKNEPVIYIIIVVFWIVIIFLAYIASYIWFSVNRNLFRVLFMFGDSLPYFKIIRGFVGISFSAYAIQILVYLLMNNSSYIILRNTILFSLIFYLGQYIVLLCRKKYYSDITK